MVSHANLTLDLKGGGIWAWIQWQVLVNILLSRTGFCLQSVEVNKAC
jgi:hypothetical protein